MFKRDAQGFRSRSLGVLRLAFVLCGACSESGMPGPLVGVDSGVDAADARAAVDAIVEAPVDTAASPDASSDSDVVDTRWPAAFEWQGQAPALLSQTGLFANTVAKAISPHVQAFAPRFALWSDAAVKQRWVWLPPGTQIDTSDMNHWRFPIGTRFFKEFGRDGKRLETRMIVRTGQGDMDYFMASYVWDEQEQDATLAIDGATNVRGTDHDVPKAKDCWACHQGDKGRALGFSALQLAGVGQGLRMASLMQEGRLSHAPSTNAQLGFPGEGVTKEAFGYLHANCGHCHSDIGIARPDTEMILRLDVDEREPSLSALYKTVVGKALFKYRRPGFTLRVEPGHPETSALLYRLAARQPMDAMPPLGTKHADPDGVDVVTAWIKALPPAL